MLTRPLTVAGLAALITAALLAAWLPAAQARPAGGKGNGTDPLTSVQCGQAWTPSCTLSAGTPGRTGTTTTAAGGSHGGTGGSGGCAGTVNARFGCVPPGCEITVETLACPFGIPGAPGPGAAPPPPGTVAQLAVRYLQLPGPVIRSSPGPRDLQLVSLPTWLWISPAVWAPQSKTASVPGESVTVTATPVSVAWRMGDGTTVTCDGPGAAYTGSADPAAPSPACGYTYTRSSAGQPGGAFRVTATIKWTIFWFGGGLTGRLPPLFSAAAAAFRVAESQAVNITGGQG